MAWGGAGVSTPTLHRGGHPLPVSVCCVADKQARLVATIENQLIANGRHGEALQCEGPVNVSLRHTTCWSQHCRGLD